MSYKEKYLKYKTKYLNIKNLQLGGMKMGGSSSTDGVPSSSSSSSSSSLSSGSSASSSIESESEYESKFTSLSSNIVNILTSLGVEVESTRIAWSILQEIKKNNKITFKCSGVKNDINKSNSDNITLPSSNDYTSHLFIEPETQYMDCEHFVKNIVDHIKNPRVKLDQLRLYPFLNCNYISSLTGIKGIEGGSDKIQIVPHVIKYPSELDVVSGLNVVLSKEWNSTKGKPASIFEIKQHIIFESSDPETRRYDKNKKFIEEIIENIKSILSSSEYEMVIGRATGHFPTSSNNLQSLMNIYAKLIDPNTGELRALIKTIGLKKIVLFINHNTSNGNLVTSFIENLELTEIIRNFNFFFQITVASSSNNLFALKNAIVDLQFHVATEFGHHQVIAECETYRRQVILLKKFLTQDYFNLVNETIIINDIDINYVIVLILEIVQKFIRNSNGNINKLDNNGSVNHIFLRKTTIYIFRILKTIFGEDVYTILYDSLSLFRINIITAKVVSNDVNVNELFCLPLIFSDNALKSAIYNQDKSAISYYSIVSAKLTQALTESLDSNAKKGKGKRKRGPEDSIKEAIEEALKAPEVSTMATKIYDGSKTDDGVTVIDDVDSFEMRYTTMCGEFVEMYLKVKI